MQYYTELQLHSYKTSVSSNQVTRIGALSHESSHKETEEPQPKCETTVTAASLLTFENLYYFTVSIGGKCIWTSSLKKKLTTKLKCQCLKQVKSTWKWTDSHVSGQVMNPSQIFTPQLLGYVQWVVSIFVCVLRSAWQTVPVFLKKFFYWKHVPLVAKNYPGKSEPKP